MSLLDEYSEKYVIIYKMYEPDGYGGYRIIWYEGATISGSLAQATQSEVTVAEARQEKVTHTLLIDKALELDYHTVLRRVKDGKIFRVTSNGDEVYTPASSNLNKRKIMCEEWSIPVEENG